MPKAPQSHTYEVNAILWVSKESEEQVQSFLIEFFQVRRNRLQSDLHLTVYHGRRVLPYLQPIENPTKIIIDTKETRFMTLKPGGENPREDIDARTSPIGIRLTKRNSAVPDIQRMRRQIYRLENKWVTGTRRPTTAWTNCFGSKNYQPHIQLLRPWHKTDDNLGDIGEKFRAEIGTIEFDRFQIEERHRVDGQWEIGRGIGVPRNLRLPRHDFPQRDRK